jgi:ferric-dicitrate binding protein FerR (iron transport regulator)
MPATSFDKEQGWQLLSQQISGTSAHVVELKREIVSSTREEAPASTAPFIRRSWYIAAACLPLFLVASWLIWRSAYRKPQWVNIQTTTIKNISLPDGSSIQLQPGTILTYPETFKPRLVQLIKGTAYFSVAKDEKRTFRVQMTYATVSVLGTAFSVTLADNEVKVMVTEGKVCFTSPDTSLILTKGEMGRAMMDGPFIKTSEALIFTNVAAEKVAAVLSDYYHVPITLPDTALRKKKITGNFQHLSAGEVQKVLNAILEE